MRTLDREAQTKLAEYISRPPISLKKICDEPFKGRVLLHTEYSKYFKENVHMFDAMGYLAELTRQSCWRESMRSIRLSARSAGPR